MNLFELFVKIGVDDQASGKLKDLGGKLGNGLKTAAKIGTAAVGAAAAGITALTTAAVNNYAEYEQLVGGVDTLFKSSSKKVQEYAANAYKTAGMSANEYMSTVTSFSASLLQSLGGDTNKAAEYANQALTDMSDNANKMGTSMEMIQNAYQGFAKQNYTMLDNLKLGYGGTKEEMARLIADAAKLSDTVDAQDMSFANIVKAINVVQTEMGITGTTALEAGRTIIGSVGAMKSAWTNLVTGFADGNADIEGLINNLVTTIVGDGTESNLGVIGNVLPAIETALGGIVKLIEGAAPKIIEILPGLIERIVPTLISAATSLVDSVIDVLPGLLKTVVKALNDNLPILAEAAISILQSLIDGISQNQKMIMTTAMKTITYLANSLLNMLPQIAGIGIDLILSLVDGIVQNLPMLVYAAVSVIEKLADMLSDEQFLTDLIDAALEIIYQLGLGLIDSASALLNAAIKIITTLVEYMLNPENLKKIISMALDLVIAIAEGLIQAAGELVIAAAKLGGTIVDNIFKTDWKKVGKDIVSNIWDGLKTSWEDLTNWFSEAWGEFKAWLNGEVYEKGGGAHMGGQPFGVKPTVPVDLKPEDLKTTPGYIGFINKSADVIKKLSKKTAEEIEENAELTAEELEEIEKKRLERQKNLREEFLDYVVSTTEEMVDIEEEYLNKLDERTQKIKNSFDIFEEYQEAEQKSGKDMLKNIYAQNNAIAQFYANIEKLEARGASTSLVEEFLSRGVSSAAELSSLLGMSDYQLQRYFQGYADREQIASKYANMQLSEEKQELQNQLATMFDSISAVYDENAEELGVSFIDGFIQKIKDGTANIAKALQETISTAIAQAMGTQSLLKTGTANESFVGSLSKALVGAIKGDNNSNGLGVYLNGDLLVGGITDGINNTLGTNYSLDTRGAMA